MFQNDMFKQDFLRAQERSKRKKKLQEQREYKHIKIFGGSE
jgi:hypothetical protein